MEYVVGRAGMIAGGLPARPAAVVFDLDGTLLDSERLHQESMYATAEALGLRITPAMLTAMVGVHREFNQAMLERSFGPAFSGDAFYAESDRRFDALAAEGIPRRPGVAAILDTLDRLSIRYAVATSTLSPHAQQRLERAGLLHQFETVVTRSDVVHPKPAPDPYLLAAERLGVDPADCVAVEDSLVGLRSAAAAGMTAIMVPDLVPANADTARVATLTFASLSDLADAFLATARL